MGTNLESSWSVGSGAGNPRMRKGARLHFRRKLSLNNSCTMGIVFKISFFFCCQLYCQIIFSNTFYVLLTTVYPRNFLTEQYKSL